MTNTVIQIILFDYFRNFGENNTLPFSARIKAGLQNNRQIPKISPKTQTCTFFLEFIPKIMKIIYSFGRKKNEVKKIMLQKYIKFLIFIFFIIISTSETYASAPVAVFKDWTVFTVKQGDKKLCYTASLPFKKEGDYIKRGEPFVTITRVKGSKFDEINATSGFIYKIGNDVEIEIEMNKYVLFPYEERAWASNRSEDIAIVNKMKKGLKMKVTGYSTLGTYATDTYSLLGFTDAYNKMVSLCE